MIRSYLPPAAAALVPLGTTLVVAAWLSHRLKHSNLSENFGASPVCLGAGCLDACAVLTVGLR